MDKQSLTNHFRNYRRELNETRHIYLPDPRTLNTMDRLTYQGAQAARYAAEFREMIETMESYQSMIYDRVQELTTAPYHTEIHLIRESGTTTRSSIIWMSKRSMTSPELIRKLSIAPSTPAPNDARQSRISNHTKSYTPASSQSKT